MTTKIEVFNPYQYVTLDFLNGLDVLAEQPLSMPIIAQLSQYQYPNLASVNSLATELHEASEVCPSRATLNKTLALLSEKNVLRMEDRGRWDGGVKAELYPETRDLYVSLAAALGSWQLDFGVSWRRMLGKTVASNQLSTPASYAFGLLHTMTANEHCTGGSEVPDWAPYQPAIVRLVRNGIARQTYDGGAVQHYALTDDYQKPAAELVEIFHQTSAYGMRAAPVEEFLQTIPGTRRLPGLGYLLEKSVQKY